MAKGKDNQTDVDRSELDDEERRRTLVKMGRFAGLTAPAIITLVTADASEVWAQSLQGGRPVRPPKKPPGKPPGRPVGKAPGRPVGKPSGLRKS